MTTIVALRVHPEQIPEDITIREIKWRDRFKVSPRLADFLDKMVRYDYLDRYST